ncbi:MAG: GHKL domain-containing protein [Desulfuromonadaceae bacterium]|nr:GHKL domain-containing protein [Desulfuromonadaceae bacterium]
METYFAEAERASEKELVAEIVTVNNSPVMTGLLHLISGLLLILNVHRQIVSLNSSLLKMLGIEDTSEALGLRPGEALQCIHAHEEPAGCGTTKYCSTCGAAIAIVASLSQDKPAERICALTVNREEKTIDIAFLVRSQAIKINGTKFLLLFMQDITLQQYRAALERTFFHDINNMLSGLVGASELLYSKNSQSNLVNIIRRSSLCLKQEIEIQRCLLKSDSCTYIPLRHEVKTTHILEELQSCFSNHPAAINKNLQFSPSWPTLTVNTDTSLLLRVLCNMITNALEATEKNGTVKVWTVRDKDKFLVFCVWNSQSIPENIAQRIFQRNFSTKEGAGRGIGTYSMKLFGEQILAGKVSFTTSHEEGTVFRFSLPLRRNKQIQQTTMH